MTEVAASRKGRAKIWTYMILAVVLIGLALIVNLAFSNTETAKHGVSSFLGLPSWVLAVVTMLAGGVIFWIGLKVEADWPEFVGSFLIAGSVGAIEMIVGWRHFELGLVVLPYLIPLVVFVLLLMIGLKKSV